MEIKKIVWATDFNPLSNYAFEWAKLIAVFFNAKLYALHVVPERKPVLSLKREELENMFEIIEKESSRRARENLEKKKEEIKNKIEFEAILLRGEISDKIIEFLNEVNADLLVIGTKREKEKIPLGTNAYRILTKTRIPVLVIPSERSVKIRKILVPVDFSKLSFKALEYTVYFAEKFGAEIHLLHVAELLESIGVKEVENKLIEETKNLMKKESEKFEGKYKIFINAIKRDAAEIGIIEFADENDIDIICMATRGRKGFSHLFLGSTTEKVIKLADRPVLAFNPIV